MPRHGETWNIKVIIDGVEYDAQLKNQGFDRNKYDGHAEVVQIRYNEGSGIVKRLREVFSSTWNYVESIKNLPENINRKFTIRIPDNKTLPQIGHLLLISIPNDGMFSTFKFY